MGTGGDTLVMVVKSRTSKTDKSRQIKTSQDEMHDMEHWRTPSDGEYADHMLVETRVLSRECSVPRPGLEFSKCEVS